MQDFCGVTVTIRVLWAPTIEQNCKSVREEKQIHSFSGFGFGSCLSASCNGISAVKLLRGVVSHNFFPMTENPSGLAKGGEIKVGSQAFSVLQLVNFVLGRINLICLCLRQIVCLCFDLYYKGKSILPASS